MPHHAENRPARNRTDPDLRNSPDLRDSGAGPAPGADDPATRADDARAELAQPGAGRVEDVVPFGAALRAWFAISLQTFGGPAGQIAVMQRALVDDRRWIGQRRFLHALNYCMLLPGPEAHQLAIYVGWLLNGLRGGLAAGILFVLPGMVALLALSAIYVGFGDTTAVAALFTGLGAAVIAIVVQAVVRVGRRALTHPVLVGLAVAAFVALAAFGVPFPIVIGAAALLGWLAARRIPALARAGGHAPAADDGPAPLIPDDHLHTEAPSRRRTVTILAVGLLVWTAPVALIALITGVSSVYTTQGVFFSGAALVTFGGAYAVLAYVAQQAVTNFGWLTATDMTRGLALAESTPGPLIMVVQFVAFLGAYANPGPFDPWTAGIVASLLVTWVTFVPSFLFIFLGAPYIEALRSNRTLAAALTGITAAVVGVIANLALYFAVTTLFAATRHITTGPLSLTIPELTSLRPVPLLIAAVAALLVFATRWSVLRVLGVCATLGLAAGLLGLPVA
ncbi:chromate efflux transporter [Pseudonocardia sichuanensis]|uniref:Chromate transporter n=1 Tax=Pseudonocardia kunmingensis TaxID=630975 RepID=A0A543D9T2_9PSEU|nr:chromate efflux transporter [Pseudonocardia kunmingensis]TQM06091.1 chromate transporter [Pseudonocardia kunmingensis]